MGKLENCTTATSCQKASSTHARVEQQKRILQEQVAEIPAGAIVEVRTKLKNMKKVRGRLGTVTKEGFEVQVARGQAIDNLKLSFTEVKSIAEKPQKLGTHPAIYVLAGVGITVAVPAIVGIILSRGS